MQKLTKAEEQIMMVLWQLEQAFLKDIIEQLPKPKPHYNTVSTIIKILNDKGFVAYEAFGKTYRYYPVISKEDYSRSTAKGILSGYFNNSAASLVSFFVKEKELSVQDLEVILKELKNSKSVKK